MSTSFASSNLFRLFIPLIMIAGILVGLNHIIAATQANSGFVTNLPYILFGTAFALSHSFKQSRIAMVALSMLLAYGVIQLRLQSPLSTGTTLLELSLLSLLLPVACCLAFLFPDTGVLSKGMYLFSAIVISFLLWSYLILSHFATGGFNHFDSDLLLAIPEISRLPLVLVLYSLAITGATGIFLLNYNRPIDAVVYTSILLASSTFIFFHVPHMSSTLFSLAGVLVIIYVISASHQMAFNDRLTNIPGRRALEMDMKHLGRKFTVAMLDVDHFKKFNDTYGHDTGDDVLKLVASRMLSVGGNARVYRYGGEEFTILFKGKTAKDSKVYLDELREKIADYEMVIRNNAERPNDNKKGAKQRSASNKGSTVSITVSIGAADSKSTKKPEEVLKKADKALYSAKEKGRNQVQCTR
ncbi:GGDEF domain-containing protein [Vibrio sp. McD22-P3]|uniref:GGDEF domain-containing protein n=1 Tax=Vibrio sp. McD22-P3 TaxID=2724880 RepID=UPI001F22B5D0|nr:GGDEF domain-containing protein [Vibrio sp. McD22-P3]MCF4174507.1 GGDEF domain-containing protein [Vibrio sp. McD22-P3]